MNYISKTIFFLLLLMCVTHSYACQLSIPESYVPTFLNPPVSGHYEKCESEPCHCVDKINPYFAELVDNYVLDYVSQRQYESCLDQSDCDDKFSRIVCTEGEEIKNYETLSVYCAVNVMKIEGKKLVESAEKKAAHESLKALEKQVEIAKIENKKLALEQIKAFEPKATTIAGLKAELKAFSDSIKKVLE